MCTVKSDGVAINMCCTRGLEESNYLLLWVLTRLLRSIMRTFTTKKTINRVYFSQFAHFPFSEANVEYLGIPLEPDFCINLPVPLKYGYDVMIKYNFFHLLSIRELKMTPCHADNPKLQTNSQGSDVALSSPPCWSPCGPSAVYSHPEAADVSLSFNRRFHVFRSDLRTVWRTAQPHWWPAQRWSGSLLTTSNFSSHQN